jgi:hypothetical protein
MALKAVNRGCLIMFSSSLIRVTRFLVTPVPALNLSCDPRYRPEMHQNPNFDMDCWALKPHTPDYRDGHCTSSGTGENENSPGWSEGFVSR